MEMTAIALEKDGWQCDEYVLIEWFPVPSMAPEFDPGPNEGFNFYTLNTQTAVLKKLAREEVRELYKRVKGRNDRIAYWQAMQVRGWTGDH